MFFAKKAKKIEENEVHQSEGIQSLLPMTVELADISRGIYISSRGLNDCSQTLTQISNEVEIDVHRNKEKVNEVKKEVGLIQAATENINAQASRNEALSRENLKHVTLSLDSLQISINQIEDFFNYFNQVAMMLEKLNNYSTSIENVTSYLDQIASKTSLVSINASIEAARAGEAGRGFMVITEEIKNLASQSKEFSNNIGGMIHNMTECIETLHYISNKNRDNIAQTKQSITELEHRLKVIAQGSAQLDDTIQETLASSSEIRKSVEAGNDVVAELLNVSEGTTHNSKAMIDAVMTQNEVVGQLNEMNERAKAVSEQQLDVVLGPQMEEKLISIGEKIAAYEGPRDSKSLQALANNYLLHNINYIDEKGCFEAAANEASIGFNIFNVEPQYKQFKTSSLMAKAYPLSRNLFTGEIIRFVVVKQLHTKQLISMGFNLEALRKISEMTKEEMARL